MSLPAFMNIANQKSNQQNGLFSPNSLTSNPLFGGISNQGLINQISGGLTNPLMLGNQELLQQMGMGQMPQQLIGQMGLQDSNSMLMSQMQPNTQIAQGHRKDTNSGSNGSQKPQSAPKEPSASEPIPIKAMHYLITKLKWEPEFAAAWLGQAVAETGDPELKDLDVVEKGARKGRGMFQYTDDRRWAYDSARRKALQQGKDVTDIRWQIDYALNQDNPGLRFNELREGLTNPDKNYKFEPRWGTALGRSPSGERYKDKFKDANSLMKAYGKDKIGAYTRALAGEYVRPGTIHLDKRDQAARKIFRDYTAWKNRNQNKNAVV